MNQNSGSTTTEHVETSTNSSSTNKKHSYYKKIAVSLVIVLALLIAFSLRQNADHKNSEKMINTTMIKSLALANNCSDKALNSISKEQVSPKEVNSSIVLLSYKASCLDSRGDYKQALSTYNELKSYYSKQSNNAMINTVNAEISSDEYAISHPSNSEPSTQQGIPDLTPEAAKKIEAQE